jgi:pSer/pThr/pTyr-binding forkhead associated (FHA) protein
MCREQQVLKLQFKDSRRDAIWLVEERYTIGKSQTSSIVIQDAAHHHALLHIENDQATIACMSTDADVIVNNQKIDSSVRLNKGDIVEIGGSRFFLTDPQGTKAKITTKVQPVWKIIADASWMTEKEFDISRNMTIGRDQSCDICLPIDTLSRQHAQFSIRSGRLFLSDLGSSNGSFVNGKQVSEVELHNNDKVKLDLITFSVRGHASDTDTDKTVIRQAPSQRKPSIANPNTQEAALASQPSKAATHKAKPAHQASKQAASKATQKMANEVNTQSGGSKAIAWLLLAAVLCAGIAFVISTFMI